MNKVKTGLSGIILLLSFETILASETKTYCTRDGLSQCTVARYKEEKPKKYHRNASGRLTSAECDKPKLEWSCKGPIVASLLGHWAQYSAYIRQPVQNVATWDENDIKQMLPWLASQGFDGPVINLDSFQAGNPPDDIGVFYILDGQIGDNSIFIFREWAMGLPFVGSEAFCAD